MAVRNVPWQLSSFHFFLHPFAPPLSCKGQGYASAGDLCRASLFCAAPVKVIGDIHGQYADLMHLFRVYGTPSRLGDISMVDYLVREELWGSVPVWL